MRVRVRMRSRGAEQPVVALKSLKRDAFAHVPWSKGVVLMGLNSMCQPAMGGADE
jgi:hypothetical protein